jgi:hypothetical protein
MRSSSIYRVELKIGFMTGMGLSPSLNPSRSAIGGSASGGQGRDISLSPLGRGTKGEGDYKILNVRRFSVSRTET